ncbi:MAG TPA: DegV family protein [Anaerolineales bacterium]|nr:DegV family protein [Anaerolineales bacterium]
MSRKVAIVTDSTTYIPEEILGQYQIKVAPQVVIWGGKEYLDNIDMTPKEFYTRLQVDPEMPKTSQVPIAQMEKIFTELDSQGYDILAMLISAKLSGTMNSAEQAKKNLPGATIEIVDSNSTVMALGFQVLQVAKAAGEGASLADCRSLAEKARQHTGILFAVDTLEFLHRGGRIGGGARFIGTALNLKPILEVKDGAIEAVERVRTRKKSLNRLVELVEERVGGKQPIRLATLHANAAEEARELLKDASARLSAEESVFSEVSPAVGAHTGPGTIGLAFMAGM